MTVHGIPSQASEGLPASDTMFLYLEANGTRDGNSDDAAGIRGPSIRNI